MTDENNDGRPPLNENGANGHNVIAAARAQLKLPEFWEGQPKLWVMQVEATFANNNITSPTTKYRHIITHLPSKIMEYIANIVLDEAKADGDKYQLVIDRITNLFSETQESKLQKLLSGVSRDDAKPSQYLQKLRNMAGTSCSDTMIKTIFLKQLPESVRLILASVNENTTLDELSKIADSIIATMPEHTIGENKTQYQQPFAEPVIGAFSLES